MPGKLPPRRSGSHAAPWRVLVRTPARGGGDNRTIGAVGIGRPWATVPASVLIVDDHPSFRASARRLLEAEGYLVVGEAPDGASALSRAAELAPDLVLLDVALPDQDGFEVAR